MRLTLASSLDAALDRGLVREHGRLQRLCAKGFILNDCSHTRIQPEWRPPLDAALSEWRQLEREVDGLELVSVYARGAQRRGALRHVWETLHSKGGAAAPVLLALGTTHARRTEKKRLAAKTSPQTVVPLLAVRR